MFLGLHPRGAAARHRAAPGGGCLGARRRDARRAGTGQMALLAEVVTAEEAAAGEIDEQKLSAMAAAFGQSSLGRLQLAHGAPGREGISHTT